MKKRKINGFSVLCVVAVLAVLFWAVTIITDLLNEEDKKPNQPHTNISIPNDDTQQPVDDNQQSEDDLDLPPVPIVTETPDEDKTIFTEDAPKPVYTHTEMLIDFPENVLSKTDDAGQEYIDSIVFIGDSTTHGLAHYGMLSGGKETKQVWTPKSGTLAMWNLLTENIVYPDDDSEMLITDALALKKPERVVLTLGVNGVSSLDEADFKVYYSELITAIKDVSPDTQIILQSIYPVCDYYEYVESISMEKINTANKWIVQLAYDHDVFYLNTIAALVDENGYLKEEYCNGDGIHISPAGFKVILEYIRTHTEANPIYS